MITAGSMGHSPRILARVYSSKAVSTILGRAHAVADPSLDIRFHTAATLLLRIHIDLLKRGAELVLCLDHFLVELARFPALRVDLDLIKFLRAMCSATLTRPFAPLKLF
jgi:hypothetical protein